MRGCHWRVRGPPGGGEGRALPAGRRALPDRLGHAAEAETAFQAAIAEALRCRLHFLEMLAHCDYIEHVLDPAGRREEQLVALGACIKKMVSAPGEFTALLGHGLNAEAAVAAASE